MANTTESRKRVASTAERIVRAATEMFLSDGYSHTNLDQVAAAAGVTKPTVYSHFGSKEGLLLAITRAYASDNAQRLTSSLASTGDPRTDLMKFGGIFMKRVQSKEAHGWQRLALAESGEHPEVGEAIYAAGPARVIKALKAYIKGETEAGRLTCPDPELATEQFLGLLLGVNPIRMMTGQPVASEARQRRVCAEAVNTFLAAFGTASC